MYKWSEIMLKNVTIVYFFNKKSILLILELSNLIGLLLIEKYFVEIENIGNRIILKL